MDPEEPNNVGPLAMVGGALVSLFGAGTLLGRLLGEPIPALRVVVGAAAFAAGLFAIRWGHVRSREWSARRAVALAAIPTADRIDGGDVLERVAVALRGVVVAGRARTLREALTESDERWTSPEAYDRVELVREAIPQVAYHSSLHGRASRLDAGPGIREQGYWRVRAAVTTDQDFHIVGKDFTDTILERLGAPAPALGDESFDREFVVSAASLEWLRANLTAELRALLLRHPTMLLRCHRGRVEALWPSVLGPQTVSRFEDASTIVSALARALSEPPGPFR